MKDVLTGDSIIIILIGLGQVGHRVQQRSSSLKRAPVAFLKSAEMYSGGSTTCTEP